jgi:peroxiredoxin Q/BCP
MNKIEEGQAAPNFTGKDQNGSAISLQDFKGDNVVIYFYPKDDTPGCTAQACNLRDNHSELLNKGIKVVGVSADSEEKHQKFIKKYDLPFPLIADTDKSIIQSFGVWGEKKFMGKVYDGIHRTTFILDKDGTVMKRIDKVKTKDHTNQILEALNLN